jgi:hypothetical protein
MMTLELDDETAILLARLAEQEHIGAVQVVKKALVEHANAMRCAAQPNDELLTEFIKTLPELPSFQGDPLDIQKAMRDEWD